MTVMLTRIVMAAATASLGAHRQGWKLAMEAELEEAMADGHGLPFALGCLTTAWRDLPAHIEGQLTLASYTFILGLILPAATLLLVGISAAYPFLYPPIADVIGSVASMETLVPRLNAANAAAIPALAFILLLRVGSDALAAWFVAERDWTRTAAAQRFGAATTVTLAIAAGLFVSDGTSVVLPAMTLGIEAIAIALLRQWHGEAEENAAPGQPA